MPVVDTDDASSIDGCCGENEGSGCCNKSQQSTSDECCKPKTECDSLYNHETGSPSEGVATCCQPGATADTSKSADGCCEKPDRKSGCCSTTQQSTLDDCCEPKAECDNLNQPCCVDEVNASGYAGTQAVVNASPKDMDDCCSIKEPIANSSCATAGCCASVETPAKTGGQPCHTEPANPVKQTSTSTCVDKCCEFVEPFDPDSKPNACSAHLRAAFDKFEALIRQSKCICRSVVQQMGVSCCSLSPDGSIATKPSSPIRSMVPKTSCDVSKNNTNCRSNSPEGCCAKKQDAGGSIVDKYSDDNLKRDACCVSKAGESCCSGARENAPSVILQKDSCCGDKAQKSCGRNDKSNAPGVGLQKDACCVEKAEESCCGDGRGIASKVNSQKDSCCDGQANKPCGKNGKEDAASDRPRTTVVERPLDVEHDAARVHIALCVSGMTCTGCSTKMMNVLTQMPGLHKPEVTFVSGSATFELDSAIISIDEALPLIEKRTGFKCSRVVEGYLHLDVYMNSEIAKDLESKSPDGLASVTKAKKTYRITYNPHIVGARDLLPPAASLAPPTADATVTEGRQRLLLMAWYTAIAAAFTIPVVVLNWAPNPVSRQTRDIVSLVLATVVQAIAVPEFYLNALKSLIFSKVIEMDMLVVISITAAYAYSVIAFGLIEAGIELEQHAFFETSTLLITLVLLGRLIAAFARTRAVRAVSMRSLQVDESQLLLPGGGTKTVDSRLLQFGDSIVVRPHSRIVTDATVISGTSSVDESMLTGETVPVSKAKGDTIIAGTLNGEGVLHARLLRLPGANSVDDIARSVEKALSAKPRVQDLADKVASWFVPVVVVISLVVFAIWIAVALEVRGASGGGAVGSAITYAIAVLAVSCPCALGLAVPMVLVIAGGVAARAGVVIKAADATERSYQATDVVFDKTGTLTMGDLTVVRQEILASQLDATEVLSLAVALLKDDKHPVARAVTLYLEDQQLQPVSLGAVTSVPGSGMQAEWNGNPVRAGNPFWLGIESNHTVATLLSEGMTCLCLTLNETPLLAFGLKDRLREEAVAVTSALHKRNITCHIVSGDHAKAVESVASSLDLDKENIASRRSPTQKQEYVEALQGAGKTVIFCGDGTNDAVALAQANVGVQMGTASDVSGAVADVVLLGGLDGLLTLLDVSKRAFARITFNFVWSAVYNVFAILLAAGAFVKFRIPPAYAGLGEIVSVGPVILAAVSLLLKGRTAA